MLIIHLNAQSTVTRWPNDDAGSDCAIRHLAFIYDIYVPKHPYVCSNHFMDGKPTDEHPYPEKSLGYDVPGKEVGC